MLRTFTFLAAVLLLFACETDGPQEPSARVASERDSPDQLFPVREDGQWGYIDSTGELSIEPRFEQVWRFSDGLALVKEGGSFGYIRPDGSYALEPRFDDAWHFANGLAPVELEGEWGFIDTTGTVVADTQIDLSNAMLVEPPPYDDDSFHLVRSGGRYGFSSSDGERVIEPRFEQAWKFTDGLARVKTDGKWGFINHDGEFEIQPRFDRAWDFNRGLAMVHAGDTVGYVNREGRYVWPAAR